MKKVHDLMDQGHDLITQTEHLAYKVTRDGLPEWLILLIMSPFVILWMVMFICVTTIVYTMRYLHVVLATVVIGYVLASLLWLGTTP